MSAATHERMRSSKKALAAEREARRRRSQRFFVAGVAGLIALLVVAIMLTRSQDTESPSIRQTREVSVSGEALPPLEETDDAIGMKIPEAAGESFTGGTTRVDASGPAVILFLAHWCPHCQAEVPVVQSWLDSGGLPDGVDIVSVSTATDPAQPNYPPSEWLEREGWSVPVLVDDADSTTAAAFGVNSYPFFVFVDSEGRVHHRASGELGIEHIESILDEMGT